MSTPRWERWKQGFRHAFAVGGPEDRLTEEDRALLGYLARKVRERRLDAAAALFLESVRPLGFLGGQALHFLHGVAGVVMDAPRLEKLAKVLEKREGVAYLIDRLGDESEPPPPDRREGEGET